MIFDHSFCCLTFKGPGIPDKARTELFIQSQVMLKRGKSKMDIKKPFMNASLCTNFERGMLGTISGIKFTAFIDHEKGDTEAEFIVRQVDLETFPIEDYSWFIGAEIIEKILEAIEAFEQENADDNFSEEEEIKSSYFQQPEYPQ